LNFKASLMVSTVNVCLLVSFLLLFVLFFLAWRSLFLVYTLPFRSLQPIHENITKHKTCNHRVNDTILLLLTIATTAMDGIKLRLRWQQDGPKREHLYLVYQHSYLMV
jgi:hypothetical protein